MKILHIITGLNDGGAEAVLYRLCTAASEASPCEHTVVSLMDEGKYGPMLKQSGIAVYCLYMPPGRVQIRGLRRLWNIIRVEKPDVVQTWMYHADLVGGVVARLAGVRTVVWNIRCSYMGMGAARLSTRLVIWLCGVLSYWIPKKIINNSMKSIHDHKSRFNYSARFAYIPNGVSTNRFYPDLQVRKWLQKTYSLNEQLPILGMVARYDPLKDHCNLIKALAILKNCNIDFICLLVGYRIEKQNCELYAKIQQEKIEDQIVLLGQSSDIHSLMNVFDLHLLASQSEAFPNVLAEAMACGTPCVTTDVGDAAQIVGETGWVVPPRNPQKLAEAILEALDEMQTNPEAWKQRKQACRRRIVEQYSLEKMVDAYHRIWREASGVES